MRFTDLSVFFYYTANSNPLVLGKSLKTLFLGGTMKNQRFHVIIIFQILKRLEFGNVHITAQCNNVLGECHIFKNLQEMRL